MTFEVDGLMGVAGFEDLRDPDILIGCLNYANLTRKYVRLRSMGMYA